MPTTDITPAPAQKIAIDVMGSDRGVRTVLRGLDRALKENPDLFFLIFGDEVQVNAHMPRLHHLAQSSKIVHCPEFVTMDDRPSQVARRGSNTSMYAAVEAIKNNEATVAVSCGNTGALMALSMLILRKIPGINRPAIAVVWPSDNESGFTVLLDGGADIKADAQDLLYYAVMGASYASTSFGLQKPRIGILNVGTEPHKGRAEIQEAAKLLEATAEGIGITYHGFVEGSDVTTNKVDVVVTDGFSGNIALKSAEGVARLINARLKTAFKHTLLSRIGAMFAITSLRRMRKAIDPRQSNGGIFLGLNGTVIKAHGSSDAVAIASAVKLAARLAKHDFNHELISRLEQVSQIRSEPVDQESK